MTVSIRLGGLFPGFLGGEGVRQIEHPGVRGIDDALPVAAPSSALDRQTADDLPADVRASCWRRLRHRTLNITHAAHAVIQNSSGIKGLKDTLRTKLAKAGINFKEAVPGV